jgi:hypothetical protein
MLPIVVASFACSPEPIPAPARAQNQGGTTVPGEITRRIARTLHQGMVTWRKKDESNCPRFTDLKAAGIIARDVPLLDEWGVELRGYCHEFTSLVQSAGPDGRFETPDDIKEGDPGR